jgi:hypothetical protein
LQSKFNGNVMSNGPHLNGPPRFSCKNKFQLFFGFSLRKKKRYLTVDVCCKKEEVGRYCQKFAIRPWGL